jgi:methylenetetrahydrofolate reductase (NADPH)
MVLISDLLEQGPTFSFEFFPPKNDREQSTLVQTLRELEPLAPSFVSVTYRGGRESRQRTHDLVAGMLKTTTLTPMAHLICVGHTRLELADILVQLRKAGVENLMALGGDQPADGTGESELNHAVELVELARAVGGFSIGVAAHPGVHPLSPDRVSDRDHLADKLRLADFAVSQFFFEADSYFELISELADRGVNKPVLPGIMPIVRLTSAKRMAEMGGAVPSRLLRRLTRASESGGDEAVYAEGIAAATELCRELLAAGVPGLHFYTLNRSGATRQIYEALGISR